MISEYDVVGTINEFALPVYVGEGQKARLSADVLFSEKPYKLKQDADVSEQQQLRNIIRDKLDQLGVKDRTYISFRDPKEHTAGSNKLTFVYLGFLQP